MFWFCRTPVDYLECHPSCMYQRQALGVYLFATGRSFATNQILMSTITIIHDLTDSMQ